MTPRVDPAALREETEISKAILLEIGGRRDIRLWRSNTGAAVDRKTGRLVRFGKPGQGDLSGLIRIGPVGVALYIEVKSARGVQSSDQVDFQSLIERFGGCYVLARSVAQAVRGVDNFIAQHQVTLG